MTLASSPSYQTVLDFGCEVLEIRFAHHGMVVRDRGRVVELVAGRHENDIKVLALKPREVTFLAFAPRALTPRSSGRLSVNRVTIVRTSFPKPTRPKIRFDGVQYVLTVIPGSSPRMTTGPVGEPW